jgi:hypothetical protein
VSAKWGSEGKGTPAQNLSWAKSHPQGSKGGASSGGNAGCYLAMLHMLAVPLVVKRIKRMLKENVDA